MSDTEIAEWARFFIDGKKEIEHLKISIKVRDGSNTHLYKRLRSFASRLKMKEKENALLKKKLDFIKQVIILSIDKFDDVTIKFLDNELNKFLQDKQDEH